MSLFPGFGCKGFSKKIIHVPTKPPNGPKGEIFKINKWVFRLDPTKTPGFRCTALPVPHSLPFREIAKQREEIAESFSEEKKKKITDKRSVSSRVNIALGWISGIWPDIKLIILLRSDIRPKARAGYLVHP